MNLRHPLKRGHAPQTLGHVCVYWDTGISNKSWGTSLSLDGYKDMSNMRHVQTSYQFREFYTAN